jgi:hypothetical protein
MLAFTVQFSRYGRKPGSLGASAPRESGSVVSQRHAAASSGPNSVLGTPSVCLPSFRCSPEGERTNRAVSGKRTE